MNQPAILIVDDREENLLSLERILARVDALVVKAQNGNDALKACLRHEFALALLDVNMPDINGYELAELMRGAKSHSAVPIIFLTAAYTHEEQIFKGYSAGAVDYMVKPISSGILLNKVNVFLDIYRQRQEVIQLNRQYLLARQEAESAARTKSVFLANMSHELRTPMTGVLGMLELALDSSLDAQQREFLSTAHSSARSLLRIINDILDLAKIEAGKLTIEEEPFLLRELVAGTVDTFIPEAKRKMLDLVYSVADDLPVVVVADQVRLRQALTNLLGNAVKFTEKGKVEARVSGGGTMADGRREITFTITDSGIGIPCDKKHLLFHPFSQVDDAHTRIYGGTGLGLTISKEIVELMGGTIGLESEEGVGSTFSFTFPVREAATECAPGKQAPVESGAVCSRRGEKHRLLLAEDDPVVRQILAKMLERAKFDLEIAENGRQAVEMWEKGEYDLILMDVQMPVMDGFAATHAIREKEQARGLGHTLIVAMTAHASKLDEDSCLDAGMDAHISKPIDLKASIALIDDLIRQRGSVKDEEPPQSH